MEKLTRWLYLVVLVLLLGLTVWCIADAISQTVGSYRASQGVLLMLARWWFR